MQDKLIEILSSAKGWMTAAEIAEKGHWRSAANVGVSLGQMEKADGQVERRKSPTKKMHNGMPATEWKLGGKHFPDDKPAPVKKAEAKPAVVTSAVDVAELQKQLADLSTENSGYRSLIERQGLELNKLAAELGHARIQIASLNEQLMAGEEAIDLKDAANGYLVVAPKRKPAKLMKAESAVARAKSAAKATGRGEVFALVSVGVATRKQVKAVEFKERAA